MQLDSLEFKIQSTFSEVIKDMDDVLEKISKIESSIKNFGKSKEMDSLASKTKELSRNLDNVGKKMSGSASAMAQQMQPVAKTLEQITSQYKDLGKGFTFKGTSSQIEKQIDNLSNRLEIAKLKKQELEASGSTNGKMYEYAVRDVIKYENQIESLKNQLSSLNNLKPEIKIERIGDISKQINEEIRTVQIPASSIGYDQSVIDFVENFSNKTETLGEKLSKLTIPEIREENLEKLNKAIEKTEIKLEELRVKLANGLTMGNITESIDDKGYVRLQEQIALTEKRLEALQLKKIQVENSTGGAGLEQLQEKLSGVASVGAKVKSVLSNVYSAVSKVAKGFASGVGKIASFTKSLLKSKSASNGLSSSLKSGIKNFTKYAFGIRSLYVLFNKLRNAIKEGMNNLVQYSAETNSSVSLLKNSMTQLKNASASMVAPLLNAFAPALNQIIQLCVKAADSVNQLLSALTGKGTWIKAKTLTDDYAASLNKASKAAKGSTRAFDELKVINSNNDSGSSGTSAKDMFETVEIESKFSGMAEKIKQMWGNADFTELGNIIATKIKEALDNINWEKIQTTANKIGHSISTFINGAVETEGFGTTLGITFGEVINTGIDSANSFIDTTKFEKIGKTLADSFNSTIETIDFTEAGRGFGNGIKGILDIAIEFLENTDWQKLGNECANFIASIDWSGITNRLFEGVGAALGGLCAFLWGLIEDAWNNVVDWWYDTAYEDGEFTMSGLLKGIWDKIKDIGVWIYNNIFKPFIDGFKKAFGIHSPSTVMKEQGGFIITGLLNGLREKFSSVCSWIKELPSKLLGYLNNLPSDMKKIGKNVISGFKDGMKSVWSSVTSWLSDASEKVSGTFKKVLGIHSPSRVMAELGEYTIAGFKEGMENLYKPTLESLKAFSYNVEVTPVQNTKSMYSDFQPAYVNSYPTVHSDVGYSNQQSNSEINSLLRELLVELRKGHTIELDSGVIAGQTRKIANDYTRVQGKPYFEF